MIARLLKAGRIDGKKLAAGATLTAAIGALVLATELPAGISLGGGGSIALAELAARSPGMRVGGVALKAKYPRAMVGPASSAAAPAGAGPAPRNALASVLGSSVGPEGAVPGYAPEGPGAGGFPSDFTDTLPGVPSGTPGSASSPPGGEFVPPQVPPANLPVLFMPAPPGMGGVNPNPGGGGGDGSGGTTPVNPLPPTPVAPIPEPSTWLLLIGGFGIVGHAMRRKRRVKFA